ncbi:hypothetical protein D3C79_938100 [compost metagenome]
MIQCSFDLPQRRTGTSGDYKLGWIVIDNAAMNARVQHFARDVASKHVLAVAALDAKGDVFVEGVIDLFEEISAVVVIVLHQKRSSSGKGRLPWWICIEPNSAHRFSVGMFFPGLSKLCWSKAFFTACIRVISSPLN